MSSRVLSVESACESLEPLPHVLSVAVKVFLNALFAFSFGYVDAFLQGPLCLYKPANLLT